MQGHKLKNLFFIFCFLSSACGQWSDDTSDVPPRQQMIPPQQTPKDDTVPQEHIDPFLNDKDPAQTPNSNGVLNEDSNDDNAADQSVNLRGYPREVSGLVYSDVSETKDFVDWISGNDIKPTLIKLGELNLAEGILRLTTDATLSFPSYAAKRSFIIDTNGHNLTLVGHDFSLLKITTKQSAGISGDVQIFSTSPNLPMIDTSGSQGTTGLDASCPENESCVPVADRSTTFKHADVQVTWTPKRYEQNWEWSNDSLPEEFRTKIRDNILSETSDTHRAVCPVNSSFLSVSGPQFSGTLKYQQLVTHPSLPSNLELPQSKDSELISGGVGGTGYNGGHVSIVQLGAIDKNHAEKIFNAAGEGGLGGLNLKKPASAEIRERALSSLKISEELLLNNLRAEWTIICLSRSGLFTIPQTIKRAARYQNLQIPVQTKIFTEYQSLVLPALPAGRDQISIYNTRSIQGSKGIAGQTEFFSVKSFSQWKAAVGPKIPIPKRPQL